MGSSLFDIIKEKLIKKILYIAYVSKNTPKSQTDKTPKTPVQCFGTKIVKNPLRLKHLASRMWREEEEVEKERVTTN